MALKRLAMNTLVTGPWGSATTVPLELNSSSLLPPRRLVSSDRWHQLPVDESDRG